MRLENEFGIGVGVVTDPHLPIFHVGLDNRIADILVTDKIVGSVVSREKGVGSDIGLDAVGRACGVGAGMRG